MGLWRISVCALGRLPSEVPWTFRDLAYAFAFERLHPLPDMRNEWHLAQLATLHANANGKRKHSISDFMLSSIMDKQRHDDDRPDGPVPDMKERFRSLTARRDK